MNTETLTTTPPAHVLDVAGPLSGPGVSAPTPRPGAGPFIRTLYRATDGAFYLHTYTDGLDLIEPLTPEDAQDFLISTQTPAWIAASGLGIPADQIVAPLPDAPDKQETTPFIPYI